MLDDLLNIEYHLLIINQQNDNNYQIHQRMMCFFGFYLKNFTFIDQIVGTRYCV